MKRDHILIVLLGIADLCLLLVSLMVIDGVQQGIIPLGDAITGYVALGCVSGAVAIFIWLFKDDDL